MGVEFLPRDENVLELTVVMAQLVNTLRNNELFNLNCYSAWYVNHILRKLLFFKEEERSHAEASVRIQPSRPSQTFVETGEASRRAVR